MEPVAAAALLRIDARSRRTDPDRRLRRRHQRLFADSRRAEHPPARTERTRSVGKRRYRAGRRRVRRPDHPSPGLAGARRRNQMRSMDKTLPVPIWVYAELERWHHLSLLKIARRIEHAGQRGSAKRLTPVRSPHIDPLIRRRPGVPTAPAVQKPSPTSRHRTPSSLNSSTATWSSATEDPPRGFQVWIAEELSRSNIASIAWWLLRRRRPRHRHGLLDRRLVVRAGCSEDFRIALRHETNPRRQRIHLRRQGARPQSGRGQRSAPSRHLSCAVGYFLNQTKTIP